MEHWAKNFLSKKLTENMFKTRLDNFGNDFGHFCNFENFLISWKHFEDSTLHGTLSKKNSRKNYPKTCSNTFGQFWERLWAFLEFWKILIFWEHFEDSTLHGTLGKKTLFEKSPKTCSKHFWTIWERFLAFLENLKVVRLFENISKTRPSMEN